jgi:NAD(P)-dependent dehydrogenase (short-subunit alcohol dehydrogenase family)
MKRLQGKRAVITGAASGIGRAAALRFAEEGASVVLCDVEGDGLGQTVSMVEDAGGSAMGVIASVTDSEAVRGLVEECVGRFGGLEVFYANAGISGGMVSLLDLEVEQWRQVLDTNLIGPFLCIKHAATHMRQHGGGAIVCTASVAGLRAGAGAAHYSASKAGVISLVQLAATQLAGTGIRVNAVCPGLIETGMTQAMYDYARAVGKEHKIGQLNPLRRGGEPVEIANAVVFLASDEASYVNGQAWVVDGGLSASHPFVPGRMA